MKILKVLMRVYLSPEDLDRAIAFYEDIFGERCQLRFKYEDAGLELANVGSVLLIAGPDRILRRFKNTLATFLVDSLNDFKEEFTKIGVVILEEPKKVPTGMNMRVKHPDGTIVEYVEHTC